MKGRNAQLARVIQVYHLICKSRFGMSIEQLWGELQDRGFDVQKRTIYRDIEVLIAAGFPLEELSAIDQQRSKRWRIESPGHLGQHLNLSASDLMALYLSEASSEILAGLPFEQGLKSLAKKIRDRLNDRNLEYIDELKSSVAVNFQYPRSEISQAEIIETCRAACCEGHQISIIYHSVSSAKTDRRILGPLTLYLSRGGYYLIAVDLADKKIKTFAFPRILEAKMLESSFSTDAFDASDYFMHSFGVYRGKDAQRLVLRFYEPVASFVKERTWHPSQKQLGINKNPITLEFHLSVTPDLIQWILSFGENVVVDEPESLQDIILEHVARIGQRYRGRKSRKP